MFLSYLMAQLFRRPTTVWGRVDANHPTEGAGYEGILAILLILVLGSLLVTLWICLEKWRLAREPTSPEGYEELEELERNAERGVKLLVVASQIVAPCGALGAFVLGQGYELLGIGLSTLVLACSLPTFFFAILAWLKIGGLRVKVAEKRFR